MTIARRVYSNSIEDGPRDSWRTSLAQVQPEGSERLLEGWRHFEGAVSQVGSSCYDSASDESSGQHDVQAHVSDFRCSPSRKEIHAARANPYKSSASDTTNHKRHVMCPGIGQNPSSLEPSHIVIIHKS